MEKQNPRHGGDTGCEFHRADDCSMPTNNAAKMQGKRARYTGLTLSLSMVEKPAEVKQ